MNEKEIKTDRRSFIKKVGSIVGVSLVLPTAATFINSCEQDENPIPAPPKEWTEIDLSRYPQLAAVGGIVKILLPGKNNNNPLIVMRKSNTEFAVNDSICLHAGCEVNLPAPGNIDLRCPCHFVIFSAEDGSIITNPLPDWTGVPLQSFEYQFDSANNVLKVEV